MDEKKSEELFYVGQFLKTAGMSFCVDPGESPDFTLKGEGVCLGLELTQLFHPSSQAALSRRAVESLRGRVVSQAQSLYEKATNPPVHVSVFFNSNKRLNSAEVSPLAQKLANLVLRNLPEQAGHKSEEFDWDNRAWFPEEINRVSVWRIPQILNSHWSEPDAVYIPECSIELVQGIIEKKNAKLGSYTKISPECWLLIILDGFRLSGTFTVTQTVLDHVYPSGFKKVYLFQPFERRVYSLNTSPL